MFQVLNGTEMGMQTAALPKKQTSGLSWDKARILQKEQTLLFPIKVL